MPIYVGDNIEISVNYYSPRGLIDASSVIWLKPRLKMVPSVNTLNYCRKEEVHYGQRRFSEIKADLSRICELEDTQLEWRSSDYYSYSVDSINFVKKLKLLFDIEKIDIAKIDILALRIQLVAKRPGYLPYDETLGIKIRVAGNNEDCTNELKRAGLFIDRHSDLVLRLNDHLVYYFSKFDPNIIK